MTVLDVIGKSTEFLSRKGIESPRLQSELLLAHVLQTPRLQLYLNFERELTKAQEETLRTLVQRRGANVPLQHLLGVSNFCGLDLEVGPSALIPRPETEILAEMAWKEAASAQSPIRALDFGTGTGCLAIAMAVNVPLAAITALDISQAALELAGRNAVKHGVSGRIQFVLGGEWESLGKFHLLVSNPPYIPTAEIETLSPEVKNHDPRLALDGGPDGLAFYRLLSSRGAMMEHGGAAFLEFGDDQGPSVLRIFEEGGWSVEALRKDYTGRERFLIARWQN